MLGDTNRYLALIGGGSADQRARAKRAEKTISNGGDVKAAKQPEGARLLENPRTFTLRPMDPLRRWCAPPCPGERRDAEVHPGHVPGCGGGVGCGRADKISRNGALVASDWASAVGLGGGRSHAIAQKVRILAAYVMRYE